MSKLAEFVGWVFIVGAFLGFLDIIDFQVCAKNEGRCQIIDPTTHEVVAKGCKP